VTDQQSTKDTTQFAHLHVSHGELEVSARAVEGKVLISGDLGFYPLMSLYMTLAAAERLETELGIATVKARIEGGAT